jgi:predicted HicB family RNase H-like nuclease
MSVLSVRLPNSLHAMVKNVAAEDAISINCLCRGRKIIGHDD